MSRTWFNPHLQYFNLNQNQNKNQLSEKEKNMIWIPWTVFHNTRHVNDIRNTDQQPTINIVPNPEFHFRRSDKTFSENARIFDGSLNYLNYTKEIFVSSICNFDMTWYPFDLQVCRLELYQPEDSVELLLTELSYDGPHELPQHYVLKTMFCPKLINRKSGAFAEVHLGRPIFGSILSIYLPTGTFISLCYMVGIYKDEYLDMVITVNITLLLVLATL